jgi:hypothetical protein
MEIKYLRGISKAVLEEIVPPEINHHYRYKYLIEAFEYINRRNFDGFPHALSLFVIIVFAFILLGFAVVFIAATIFMNWAIIVDIFKNPVSGSQLQNSIITQTFPP